jgi:hypothetical protein
MVIGIVLSSIISCAALYQACSVNKQLVEPRINTYLKWEYSDINGKYTADLWNPTFKIYNDGPIKVVSMDVMYHMYVYNLDNSSYMNGGTLGSTKGKFKYIFEKEFDVFAESKKGAFNLSMDFPNQHVVAVNIFDIRYYRDSDLKEYRRKDIFFIDNGVISTHREYMKNPRYFEVVSYVDRTYREQTQSIDYAVKHLQNL